MQHERVAIAPTPTLDHVVVNAQDRLDDVATAYRRLGFTLTPRGYHTLGSANHLAMFGTDYLELIGMPAGSARRDLLDQPAGLNGLVFATENTAALHEFLTGAGIPAAAPQQFSRPVALPGGAQDAVFRTLHLTPAAIWPGRVYFCQHLTRDLVWRDEWRRHANGVVGVVRTLIASDDPQRLAGLFSRMFGADAVRTQQHGISLVAGLSRVDVLGHAAVAERLGATVDPRPEYMAALTLRTKSLAQAAAALADVAVVRIPGRLSVAAAAAAGCALEFVE